MKLDRLKFAKLIAHCCGNGMSQGEWEIERVDELCEFEVHTQPLNVANCGDVDNLMMLMADGTRKIEAIKAYRQLTGAYLKEAKDAVEKYWQPVKKPDTRVASMLNKIDEQLNNDDLKQDYILSDQSSLNCVKNFIKSFTY